MVGRTWRGKGEKGENERIIEEHKNIRNIHESSRRIYIDKTYPINVIPPLTYLLLMSIVLALTT